MPAAHGCKDRSPLHEVEIGRLAVTTRALFRFTGPEKSQVACIDKGDAWAVQSQAEFLSANGGNTTVAWLWDALPYVPKPMDDYPELEAALEKVRHYLTEMQPVREKVALHRSQGILADETELLGKIVEAHERLISMYLAKAVKLFEARRPLASQKNAVGSLTRGQKGGATLAIRNDDLPVETPTSLENGSTLRPERLALKSKELKDECADLITKILNQTLPEDSGAHLPSTDIEDLTQQIIRTVFEPRGRLRERARRDPRKMTEIVGLAMLPIVTGGNRGNVAPTLVDMLEYANLVSFDVELSDADNWPRLKARAQRGLTVA